ncbi:AGAP003691-PA-like protein [Anopheles sinensis]|uniref:AGAP003691-PA-like protein n=1 Tax=Anopheles sinensis TaxID=74873 RepID=A0A084WR49_ANOSI|nr:AGAP003691-PA-like protein [Anopheles sinensis]
MVEMGQQSVYYPVKDFGIRVRTLARKVHYHPEFNAETLENDIALLELVTPIAEFNKSLVPACIWAQDKFPVNQFQTNGYVPFEETDEETERTLQRYATADVLDECVEKVPQHQICAGFPTALVPNSCHNSIGSAMSRSLYSFDRFFEYIFAINSRGENCGFNMPTVYTVIAPFNKSLVPACIWAQDKFPVNQFQTNGYVPFEETDEETERTLQRYATADVLDECVEKVPQHQICAGFPTALVPNSCHNSIGSAMSRSLYSFDRFFEYIFAINSRGENCGFNMPTVYTVIAPYVQWIDSTKYYGDRCKNGNGVEGTCVGLTQCARLAEEVKSDQSSADAQLAAGSCSFELGDMTVCCTERDLLRNETYREQLAEATAEIDACPQLYHEFRKNKSPYKIDNFPTYPYLVRIHDEGEHSCNGTLISKQFVLTTAMCYRKLAEDKVTVVVGNSTKHNFSLHRAITHPQYGENPMEFNMVLLMLKTPVTVTNETIPACLWHNQTHTPLRLQEVYANPNYTHQYRYPLFNKECLRRNVANVTDMHLCVEKDSMFYQGFMRNDVDGGNALVSHFAQGVEEYQVTYLVGLYGAERTIKLESNDGDNDFGENPPIRYYGVYQRISEYYSWIKHVISVEMQYD